MPRHMLLPAVVIALLLFGVAALAWLAWASRRMEGAPLEEGTLPECPGTPNCVSSLATREGQRVPTLDVEGDDALDRIAAALAQMPRIEVVERTAFGLRAVAKSRIFGFADDIHVVRNPAGPGYHVRAAARVGHSDFGVNRRRIERLGELLGSRAR